MKAYKTEQTGANVLTVRMEEVKAGWEQWFLLISDVHWDNPHCDRKLLHKVLGQAKEKEAGIFCFGDFFCAMQGKWDKRASKEALRPEHRVNNYLDALVDTAADDLQPYVDWWEYLALGNHETAIEKIHETDIIGRLCKALGVRKGGYAGFVRFMFSRGGSGRTSKNLFYHHGSGGGGPVTKGVIQTNRRAVWLPDADIVASGHVHESWLLELPRQRVTDCGELYFDTQYHIQLATFKQEFDLAGGWHLERGAPPKPLGGWWLRWHWDGSKRDKIGLQVIRAD